MLIFAKLCVNLHPNLNSNRQMRQLKTLFILLSVLCLTASCLKGSNDEATLYSDAAITSFSLGTLNCYTHSVTSEGKDTVTTSTITGSSYAFHIDQVNHCIYNTDSLPVGTDVSRVVVSLTTRNNGVALIRTLEDEDSVVYYVSTDSIDFTTPRKFVVVASDGSSYSDYIVNVNVHQEKETFNWEQMPEGSFPQHPLPELPTEGIKQVLGKSTTETYALSDDNKLMVWYKDSTQWEEDLLDESSMLLPSQDLSLVSYYYDEVAEYTDYVLLVGNRSLEEYPQESIAMVWRKIVDCSTYVPLGQWVYMGQSYDVRYALPRLEHLQVIEYADYILAIGGKGLGGCNNLPYQCIYESRDEGITWKKSPNFTLPAMKEMTLEHPVISMTTEGVYLWLKGETTGEVWRGLLNSLAWRYK